MPTSVSSQFAAVLVFIALITPHSNGAAAHAVQLHPNCGDVTVLRLNSGRTTVLPTFTATQLAISCFSYDVVAASSTCTPSVSDLQILLDVAFAGETQTLDFTSLYRGSLFSSQMQFASAANFFMYARYTGACPARLAVSIYGGAGSAGGLKTTAFLAASGPVYASIGTEVNFTFRVWRQQVSATDGLNASDYRAVIIPVGRFCTGGAETAYVSSPTPTPATVIDNSTFLWSSSNSNITASGQYRVCVWSRASQLWFSAAITQVFGGNPDYFKAKTSLYDPSSRWVLSVTFSGSQLNATVDRLVLIEDDGSDCPGTGQGHVSVAITSFVNDVYGHTIAGLDIALRQSPASYQVCYLVDATGRWASVPDFDTMTRAVINRFPVEQFTPAPPTTLPPPPPTSTATATTVGSTTTTSSTTTTDVPQTSTTIAASTQPGNTTTTDAPATTLAPLTVTPTETPSATVPPTSIAFNTSQAPTTATGDRTTLVPSTVTPSISTSQPPDTSTLPATTTTLAPPMTTLAPVPTVEPTVTPAPPLLTTSSPTSGGVCVTAPYNAANIAVTTNQVISVTVDGSSIPWTFVSDAAKFLCIVPSEVVVVGFASGVPTSTLVFKIVCGSSQCNSAERQAAYLANFKSFVASQSSVVAASSQSYNGLAVPAAASDDSEANHASTTTIGLGVGLGVAAALLVIIVVAVAILFRRRRRDGSEFEESNQVVQGRVVYVVSAADVDDVDLDVVPVDSTGTAPVALPEDGNSPLYRVPTLPVLAAPVKETPPTAFGPDDTTDHRSDE